MKALIRKIALAGCCFLLLTVAVPAQQNTGSIAGQTQTADGKPLSGATLSLIHPQMGPTAGPPTTVEATSDADGKFSFSGLAPGQYVLRAVRTGYLPSTVAMRRGSSPTQSGVSPIVLTPGQHVDDYMIGLIPEGTLSGVITGDDGAPMEHVQLRAMRQAFNGNVPTAFATSDDQGRFRLTGLLSGRYYILVLPPNESDYPPGYYPGKTSAGGASMFDIAEGQDRAGADLQLHKVSGFHVRGKVQNRIETDAHFQILCVPANNDPFVGFIPKVAIVKPDGSFDLSGVAAGTWSLAAMSVHGVPKLASVTTVNVEDRDIPDVVLTANPAIDIKGSVQLLPDGTALPPMTQIILQPSGVRLVPGIRAAVASDGSFTLPAVPPAHYILVVAAQLRGYLKSARLGDRDVQVSDLDTTNANGPLRLIYSTGAGEIDGTVTGSDGKPVAGAAVTVAPDPDQPEQGQLYRLVRTRDDGVFMIPSLPPGKYRLFAADAADSAFSISPESLKPFESFATRVTLEEGGKVQTTVREITDTKSGR